MKTDQKYFFLAKCLALDFAETYRQEIIDAFESRKVDSIDFVRFADSHLVLQAIFPWFEKYGILNYLPEELTLHLKEVFELNTRRNERILEQIQVLNNTLRKEGIVTVFMKGAGNMMDHLYGWKGERIFHDIDFLVKDSDFLKASEILMNNGYKSHFPVGRIDLDEIKHFPVLFRESDPAYVEIHRIPVGIGYSLKFRTDEIFRDKKNSALYPDCFVMTDQHKMIHNFIHSQMEGQGHLYARTSLRNLYDFLLLSGRIDPVKTLKEFGYYQRKAGSYLHIMYATFGFDRRIVPGEIKYSRLQFLRFNLNLKSRFINTISNLVIRVFLSYVYKPLKAIFNKGLRRSLLKKLRTRSWYRKHFGYYLKIIKGSR